MTDIEIPKDIYDYIDKNILNIISKLELKADDEKFEVSKFEVLNIINKFKQGKIDKAIEDFKNSQEWEKFTVAFYGETNAGKSTIIEALRIYFQEEEKSNQQHKFKNIIEKHNEKKNLFKSQIETTESAISENKKKIEYLSHDFKIENEQLVSTLEELAVENLNKKENSIFYKILSFLHFTDIQKEIKKTNNTLKEKRNKYEKESGAINEILKNQIDEIAILENSIDKLEISTFELLQTLADGQIIGDGRSDFTKKSTIYNFEYNNQKFAFLDVPGIEGHEAIVIDEISSAVKKAHAVFYVTSSSTPPQKGDENKKGTLEKIKQHLGSQTEVYTIFNKRITNPMQLNKELVSDDEKESLKIVDKKITEILGKNYAGHKSVSAKIAFLALADCLLVESPIYNEQKKFLDKFSTNELVEKAYFDNLCRFISDELVVNTKRKIKKSNYNKASDVLNELIHILDKALKDNFEPLYKQIVKEVNDASSNLQNTLRKTKIDLESVVHKALRDFESNTRKEIYKYIDSNVSDDSFKNKFELLLENNSKKMVEAIPKDIEKQMSKFQNSITEVLENFKRRVDLAIQDYQTFNFGDFDSKFNVNLQIDNGISGWGIAGSLLAAGGTVYTYWTIAAANSWNLVGWTMIAAGALTALLSFGKSIYKFFDDDYKKSEQKKSADENLERIINDIRPKIIEKIELINREIIVLIDNIIDDLDNVVKQRKMTNEYIKKSYQDLVQIAKQIKLEGDR